MPKGHYVRRLGRRKRKPPIIIPVGPSIAYVPLTRGKFALIDSIDVALVSTRNWHAHRSRKTASWYAVAKVTNDLGRDESRQMHRLILDLKSFDSRKGDHENHNGLDNRRINLRKSNNSQNQHNRGANRKNATGYKGVSYDQQTRSLSKWRASIQTYGKLKTIGRYMTPELAHEAYCEAAKKLHGEFACFTKERILS